MGAARSDPRPDPYRRPLEAALGGRGARLSLGWPADSLLLPDTPRHLHGRDAHRLSAPAEAALPQPARHPDLGRVGRPQEPADDDLPASPTRLADRRTSARVCPRAEPDRTGVGQRQGAGTGQRVRVRRHRAAPAPPHGLRACPMPRRPCVRLPSA